MGMACFKESPAYAKCLAYTPCIALCVRPPAPVQPQALRSQAPLRHTRWVFRASLHKALAKNDICTKHPIQSKRSNLVVSILGMQASLALYSSFLHITVSIVGRRAFYPYALCLPLTQSL